MEKEKQKKLEGCLKSLLFLERSIFPDECCRICENLKECTNLYPNVRKLGLW